MEDVIQILAFLVFIIVSGIISTSKKMREQQKDKPIDTLPPVATPIPKTLNSEPPARQNQDRQKSNRSVTPPTPKRQPTSPAPQAEEPMWAKMLREMLDIEKTPVPEPVSVPPQTLQPQSKQTFVRKKKGAEKSVQSDNPPIPPQPRTIPLPAQKEVVLFQQPTPLAVISARAANEPLRAAILLSEIIGPPRAKRREIRSL